MKPFPTIYWLTDRGLDHFLANLERLGVIGEIERAVQGDRELRRRLHEDHRRYARQRWNALSDHDRQAVRRAGMESAFRERGVAGAANFDAVKCLHAHYAHHLADRNLVGELIDERYAGKAEGSPSLGFGLSAPRSLP